MNFNFILEELDRLYEELPAQEESQKDQKNQKDLQKTEEPVTEALVEDTEDDEEIVIEDDAEDEEVVVDGEPITDDETTTEEESSKEVQIVLECSKCGALTIKPEADIKAEEDTDLVNVDETCQYCEEAEGYKSIGTFVPYEETE